MMFQCSFKLHRNHLIYFHSFFAKNVAHDAFFSSLLMMDGKNIYSQRLLPSFILGYRYHYVSNFQVWIKYQTENNPPRHWTHFSFFHFQSRKRNIGNWNGSINLYWVFSATTQTFLPIPQKTKREQKRIGCEKKIVSSIATWKNKMLYNSAWFSCDFCELK